ncbi:MAG: hypothetical protein HC848_06005 [Limnobacter sp.]|nr:hypothetical protein [Limnobacter sp.]
MIADGVTFFDYQKEVASGQTEGDFTHTELAVNAQQQSAIETLQSIDPQGNPLKQNSAGNNTVSLYDCINNAVEQGIQSSAPASVKNTVIAALVIAFAAALAV